MNDKPRVWIAFHIIRAIPPARMNRNDLGDPKTADFGGVSRLYLSSQSMKYAWRQAMREHMGNFADRMAVRTRCLPKLVATALATAGFDPNVAAGMAELLRTIGKAESEPSAEGESAEAVTPSVLFLANGEIEATTAFAKAHAAELAAVAPVAAAVASEETGDEAEAPEGEGVPEGAKGKGAKGKAKGKGAKGKAKAPERAAELARLREAFVRHLDAQATQVAPDVGLFGRFLATGEIRVVGACTRVAHALGVTPFEMDYDFFTTRDDVDPEGPAAHMGQVALGSAVVYQYFDLAASTFVETLGDRAMAATAAAALTRVAALVTPSGAENSTAPHTPPAYLEVHVLRGAQPLNHVEAYATPVAPSSTAAVLPSAVQALRTYTERTYATFFAPDALQARLTLDPAARDLPRHPGETRVTTLEALCAAVSAVVESA